LTWQSWTVAGRPQVALKDSRSMSHAESADGSSAHRLPEGPREFLRRVGFGYVHGRFAEALETVGCRVRSVERIKTLTPPGILVIQPQRRDFLRQRDDGLCDRWQVIHAAINLIRWTMLAWAG